MYEVKIPEIIIQIPEDEAKDPITAAFKAMDRLYGLVSSKVKVTRVKDT